MSEKFRAMGNEVHVDAEAAEGAVKATNRAL
jgi:hypothetical protein